MRITVKRNGKRLYPDSGRVITRYFDHNERKAIFIINKVLQMSNEEVTCALNQVLREFAKRHRNITKYFEQNYNKAVKKIPCLPPELEFIDNDRMLLIGSFFTMEYSIESAALFNPSIVQHPDQSGLEAGQKRVIISFRATGESHISSIVFRSGIIDKDMNLILDTPGNYVSEAETIKDHVYDQKEFELFLNEHEIMNDTSGRILNELEEFFGYNEFKAVVNNFRDKFKPAQHEKNTIRQMMWLAKSHYELEFSRDTDISERVIFPVSSSESNGIEDARFVRFTDDNGEVTYYATYTAYDGFTVLPKLLETKDFYRFKNIPLHGECVQDKNFALFPNKINGRYAMLSRVDGMSQYIMFSDSLTMWEHSELIKEPLYNWELVQTGNCGSPIKTEDGWLVITHGVGQMRKYCIGAMLLDIDDPTKVIGCTKEPIIVPLEDEREGYVPNVVYTCGAIEHNGMLVIPYAVSDYASTYACVDLDLLIANIMGE